MDISRIKVLRECLDDEYISTEELSEIEEEFNQIPDCELRDERENALASDMLDEIEARLPKLQTIIYNYIVENYGQSEADDPCYAIGPMVAHINEQLGEE